jgi:hypothetical protein
VQRFGETEGDTYGIVPVVGLGWVGRDDRKVPLQSFVGAQSIDSARHRLLDQ